MYLGLKNPLRWVVCTILSDHFVNAFRTAVTVIIPVFVFYRLGNSTAAIQIGLGTLLVALTDVPGELFEKAGSLLTGTLVLALVAFVTLYALPHQVLLGLEITLFCFFFSMLFVYGGSRTAIGSMALITMVFTYGLKPANGLFFCAYILAGGLWYSLSSVLYLLLFPYRPIRHAIGECVLEIAGFLRAKASFYNPERTLKDSYKAVISGHIRVSQKQEALRSILLRERLIIRHEDPRAGYLVHIAAEVVDLYEQVLAIHFDYGYIRETLDGLQMLLPVNGMVEDIADELEDFGLSISAGVRAQHRTSDRLAQLMGQLDEAAGRATSFRSMLIRRLVDNFDSIHSSIRQIVRLMDEPAEYRGGISGDDALRFLNKPSLGIHQLQKQFTFRSPFFRFALRLSLTCLAAYLFSFFVLPGKYSYWLLLTIIIIARPAFSSTKRRNYQRIWGTLIGVPIAFLCFYFVGQISLQLLILAVFLLGYLAFLQINYLVSVVFITVVALVGLHLLGGDHQELMLQRGYETLLGGQAAVTATFLFPFWERRKLGDLIADVLRANLLYLQELRNYMMRQPFDVIAYKLVRKQVFVSSADLSRAYEHMLSEPGSVQLDSAGLYQFQILNHELYASAASVFSDGRLNTDANDHAAPIEMIDKSIAFLSASLKEVTGVTCAPSGSALFPAVVKPVEGVARKAMVSEQLQMIYRLSENIYLQVNEWRSLINQS